MSELFNYQILDYDQLFSILYVLIEYGHSENISDNIQEMIDSKEDTFRVSLICTVLESTGEFLKWKKVRQRTWRYLLFFQRYILSKKYLPMLLEFMLLDIMDQLAGWMQRYRDYDQVDQIIKQVQQDELKNAGQRFQNILGFKTDVRNKKQVHQNITQKNRIE